MASGRLTEHVAELRRHIGSQRPVARPVALDGLELSTAQVPAEAEVVLDLVLESIFEGVVLSGHIRVPWQGECRRCLGPVAGEMDVSVHEIFERNPTDGETWPLVDDEVDLEPVVRDAVLLALPLAPLCSSDCRGPAPEAFPARVATDEPEPDADPEVPPPVDPRWAALDDLDLNG